MKTLHVLQTINWPSIPCTYNSQVWNLAQKSPTHSQSRNFEVFDSEGEYKEPQHSEKAYSYSMLNPGICIQCKSLGIWKLTLRINQAQQENKLSLYFQVLCKCYHGRREFCLKTAFHDSKSCQLPNVCLIISDSLISLSLWSMWEDHKHGAENIEVCLSSPLHGHVPMNISASILAREDRTGSNLTQAKHSCEGCVRKPPKEGIAVHICFIKVSLTPPCTSKQ